MTNNIESCVKNDLKKRLVAMKEGATQHADGTNSETCNLSRHKKKYLTSIPTLERCLVSSTSQILDSTNGPIHVLIFVCSAKITDQNVTITIHTIE